MLITLLQCYFIYQTAVLAHQKANVKGCLHPGQGLHIIAAMSKDNQEGRYPVNTIISYSCKPGYEIFDNETRRCLSNGSWSGSEPYCGLNVATKENIETIKLYGDDKDFVIKYGETEFLIENTSTTTWSVKLKKIYTIDMLKLTIEVNRNSEELNPKVSYSLSHDIQSMNVTANYMRIVSTLVTADCHPTSSEADKMLERKTDVYHCPIKSPSPSQFVSFQIYWLATNLTLQNISLYTSSGRCAFADDNFCKRVVYGNKCYDLITTRASWSESEKACRRSPIRGSTLATFSQSDVKMLNYFHSVVNNTDLICVDGFWTIDKDNKSNYRMIRFPNTTVPIDPTINQNFGRICEYDISQCVIPSNSTQMSIFCTSQQTEMMKSIIGLSVKIVAIVIIVQWLVIGSIFFYIKYKIVRS